MEVTERPARKMPAVTEEMAVGDRIVEGWMRAYGPSVLRLAYAFLLDRHQAEDVFQDVFVQAYRHVDRLRDSSRIKQWLLQTAANRCRDLRRSWWWRRILRTGAAGTDGETQVIDPTPRADPAVAVAELEVRAHVARAVWDLPEGYRETVALYYFDGLSAPEVAELTGVREGTVHSRLHRARELLRTRLEEWRVRP